jgi:tetratricopeptide (TPR) repeat protein
MKNYPMSNKILSVVLAVLFTSAVFAQSAELNYKAKGRTFMTAKIYFSNQNGGEEITPEEFFDYENIFFTIVPATPDGKNYFKESEISEDLGLIKLKQGFSDIQPQAALRPVLSAEGKIEKVIMSFAKRQVKLFVPFSFVSPVDTAIISNLSDEYYKYYNKYNEKYVSGINLSDEKEYIDAFTILMEIVDDTQINEEIMHYDFYQHASETLIETCIEQQADSLTKTFSRLSGQFNKNFSLKTLKSCDSIIKKLHETQDVFAPYMKLDFRNSRVYQQKFDRLFDDLSAEMVKNYETYNKSKMQFLETKTYNVYQFSLFVDVLAQMVTHLDTLRLLKGVNQLDISVLNKLPVKKEELNETGWYNEFELLVGVINQNIKNTGKILGDSAMNNLQRQVADQRQPYYEIFLAFNNLEQKEMLFKDYLKNAIERCTDIVLIKNMEMWILGYKLTTENIDPQTVSRINEGIRLIETKEWLQATSIFDVITRQANNVAPPWFYAGVIKFENQETFSAETLFEIALKLYPQYIAPRVYSINSAFNQGLYDNLLKSIDQAILANDIWYFHSWKAKALYELKNYKQVIAEINDNCLTRNPWDIGQYFVLGDAYLELKDYTNAEIAYRKTQEINPFMESQLFNEKMIMLQKRRTQ